MFGCTRLLERNLGDLDEFFAYQTTRTLKIRDRHLGGSLLCLQATIFVYVVVWQILFSQVYLAQSDFAGVVRLSLPGPTAPGTVITIRHAESVMHPPYGALTRQN